MQLKQLIPFSLNRHSLYDKIDRTIRNCRVVVSIVTVKYGMSANCRKKVALANAIGKPIVPVVLDRELTYPPVGPMAQCFRVFGF